MELEKDTLGLHDKQKVFVFQAEFNSPSPPPRKLKAKILWILAFLYLRGGLLDPRAPRPFICADNQS